VPQTPPPEPILPAQDSSPKFILIGEDDLDDQEIFREIFSSIREEIQLQFVQNGTEVLNYLENCEILPCLIVLDYNMPELSGADILEKLKENSRYEKIPKVIWSTSGSNIFRERAIELGATDYIIKPSNVSELQNLATYIAGLC
jgi:CheY-like chemotaxis protein